MIPVLNRLLFRQIGPKYLNNYQNMISRTITWTNIQMNIFKIQNENDFKTKVLENENMVILDFFATWCGPCRQLTPRLETLVGSYHQKKVDLAMVDVDELDQIAGDYQVTSIPAVFAIKNGQIVDHFVGSKSEEQLKSFIEEALNKNPQQAQ